MITFLTFAFEIHLPGMKFCAPIVVFTASLPHAIVRCAVRPFHIEHKVLDKIHFICCVDNLGNTIS